MAPSSSKVGHQLNLFGNVIPKGWFQVIVTCQEEYGPECPTYFLGLWGKLSQPLDNLCHSVLWHFQYGF